ncbi:MAG: hypothetical protein JWP09_588 [Candidatus Taylorbacteria bacterium]|nr:hypothetical protein [Candidatus Taylorbacteria bacterium]
MKKTYTIIGLLIIIIGLIFIFKKDDTVAPVVTDSNTPVYTNPTQSFSVSVPKDFTIDEKYSYNISPTRSISGTKYTIPASLAKGTNLSTDSYVSVESIPDADSCTAERFFESAPQAPDTVTENGVTYSVNSTQDAGAGNRYEETVYAIKDSKPCIAVRYFIHYGAIQNYPEGAVKEFDRSALLQQFDAIRKSLKIK